MQEYPIIARILRGETHAYALLVDRYKVPIFNLAYRMTGSYQEADDLAQEAFIRAYQRLSYFEPGRNFFNWLYTIALNIIRNYLKKNNKTSHHERLEHSAQLEVNDTEDAVAEEQIYTKLDLCMGQLPYDMRRILILRFYQGLSFEDITAITNVSLSAAKMRVYRGLQKLHSLMEDCQQ